MSKKNNYKLFNEDTLVVVYDLSFQAITFDVAFFLVHAETYAIKNNKKQMHVIIIKEKKGGLIEKNYDSVIDYSNRIWRTKEIIISMVQLHHFTTGYTFLDNISNLDKYISNSLVYPKDYKSFNPPIKYKDFFKDLSKTKFIGFNASSQALRIVKEWIRSRTISKPIVSITIRESDYDKNRNNNLSEWIKFAKWLNENNFCPVFIPDTGNCWPIDSPMYKYDVFPECSLNLDLRLALYESSYLNFFYCTGIVSIAQLNRKVPCIFFSPVFGSHLMKDRVDIKKILIEKYGIVHGSKYYGFENSNQWIYWEKDDFQNIKKQFLNYVSEFNVKR